MQYLEPLLLLSDHKVACNYTQSDIVTLNKSFSAVSVVNVSCNQHCRLCTSPDTHTCLNTEATVLIIFVWISLQGNFFKNNSAMFSSALFFMSQFNEEWHIEKGCYFFPSAYFVYIFKELYF